VFDGAPVALRNDPGLMSRYLGVEG
jgi:hypothetical protein